jgi:ribonuclease P protein component
MKEGVSVHSSWLSLRFTSRAAYPRFSAIVSKKVAKTAVERNRIRRRVYAVLEKLTLPPLHALVMVKKPLNDITPSDLLKEIENLLAKVRQ